MNSVATIPAAPVSPTLRGFKQTDVGLIPTDWVVRKVGDVCRLINGRGFKPHEWRRAGLPIIRIQNLNGSDEFNHFNGSYNRKIEVHPEQLLFAWSGSRGTSFGPHIWKGTLGVLNYHTWKVVADTNKVSQSFLYHVLKGLTAFIESEAHGASALVHVQKWQMEGFQLALPPTMEEQAAVAEALSDADALIESLESLIAKKRAIRQGAMQELVSGRRRLPGFFEEWRTYRVGELEANKLVKLHRGEVISKLHIEATPGDFPIYSSSVHNDGLFGCYGNYMLDEELITWSIDGGGHFFYRHKHKFSVTNVCGYMRVHSSRVNCRFLASALQLAHSAKSFDYQTKAHPSVVRKEYEVHWPSLPEQSAIADVLKVLDEELVSLDERLTKARQIKQGMIQELLTGRVRLV